MKTIFIGALALLILAGCSSPTSTKTDSGTTSTTTTTATTPSDGRTFTTSDGRAGFVVNSVWETKKYSDLSNSVAGRSLARSLARSTTAEDYIAAVDTYNASNIDDYLRIYYDRVPDIVDAPTVTVYCVKEVTYDESWRVENVARKELVDNVSAWRQASQGRLLFIDHVPPPPVVAPILSQYAYWAIYAIDETGHIAYQDHCGWRVDEQFYQEDIGDYASPSVYYPLRIAALNLEVVTHPGWTLKADHTLYVPPVTP